MASLDGDIPVRVVLLWIGAAAVVYLLAGPIATTTPGTSLMIALATIVVTIAFLSTEAAIYILICSMLLSPEISASQGGIAEERSVAIRVDDLLILLIGFSWFAKSAIQKELGLFPRTPLNRPIIFYIAACVLSTAIGIMAGRISALSGIFYILKYIEYFIIFFMVTNYMTNTKQAKAFVFTALATCVIICLYGILQIPGGGRVSAPFEGQAGEPNTLGGYLVLMGAIIVGLYLASNSIRQRRGLLLLSGLIVLPLLFTLSRSSWVAAIVTYLALIVLSERRIILIVAGVFVVALSPILIPEQVTFRAISTFQEIQGYQATERFGGFALDPSASARITTNRHALEAWQKSPIWGYGITGAGIFLDSQYFRTLVELGIVGSLGFLWLIWTAFRIGKRNFLNARTDFSKGLSLGYIAGLVGLLVHGIFSTTFIIIRIMEPFWLLTAIVLLLPTIEQVEQEIEEEIQHEAMPASPLARRSKARMIEEHRVIRSRDMIRSHLDEDWH
jgi:O-antigen ligase